MRYLAEQHPAGVSLPNELDLENPSFDLPENIKKFFGKTGKWWGTWTSPQSPGGYDAILAIKRIRTREEAEIVYLTADFPKWYIEKTYWETTAKFYRNENGRFSLLIPYRPWQTHLECWFEGRTFKGSLYHRFMLSHITWRPLTDSGTGR